MTEEEKKYSFISVDAGEPETSARVEEQAGVRTSRTVVDGEDTIVVSTVASASDGEEPANFAGSEPAVQVSSSNSDSAQDAREMPRSLDHRSTEQGEDEDENVPFARMQAIIIIALVALIIVFFVYFNFLR